MNYGHFHRVPTSVASSMLWWRMRRYGRVVCVYRRWNLSETDYPHFCPLICTHDDLCNFVHTTAVQKTILCYNLAVLNIHMFLLVHRKIRAFGFMLYELFMISICMLDGMRLWMSTISDLPFSSIASVCYLAFSNFYVSDVRRNSWI